MSNKLAVFVFSESGSLDVSMLSKETCHQMYTATNTLIRVTTNSVKTMLYLCYHNYSKEQNITSYGPLMYHDQKVHTVFRHSTLRPCVPE